MASNGQSTHQLVTLSDITCRYADGPAVLQDVSMSVTDHDFIGLVGPSGSGKTTLLRVLLNVVKPVAGIVRVRPGLRVGYVPQVETINWSFPVTVAEAVLMSARGTRLPWAKGDERQRVDAILHRLGIGAIADRHIRQLSGGQQQRVFIARALFSEPDLLLMDEPTSGVDVRTRHEILHLLGELNADGLAIVLSTHDLNGMAAHLPQLICLNRTVMGVGTPEEVLTSEILERTYGAPMDVLEHAGIPLVVDGRRHHPLGAVS